MRITADFLGAHPAAGRFVTAVVGPDSDLAAVGRTLERQVFEAAFPAALARERSRISRFEKSNAWGATRKSQPSLSRESPLDVAAFFGRAGRRC